MKKKYLSFLIIILQLFFLSSMIWFHQAKLSSAVRVMLKTVPVDPMSMFRGRYVRLRYEISSLPVSLLRDAQPKDLKGGDVLFVRLKQVDDLWQAEGAYRSRPRHDLGVYLRARLPSYYHDFGSMSQINLEYGMEAFFLNEKQAHDVENASGQVTDWRQEEQRRKEAITRLDPETQRIQKANISEWWFKALDKEMEVWLSEGLIDAAAKDSIHNKYAQALEKVASVNRIIGSSRSANQKPIYVEVAIDREGNGYPARLFCEGKIYN